MANKYITDVDTLDSLADGDSLFVNSDGSLKQVAVGDAGLMRMELLWENAALESAFEAQTISLDLSDYDAIIIRCSYAAGYTNANEEFIPIGGGSYVMHSGVYNYTRLIRPTTNGITIDAGYVYKTYAGTATVDNSRVIPYQIYGIKGTSSKLPSLITFSLNGGTYRALEGMTWAEWVNSGYNTYSSGTIGALGSVVTLGTSTLVLSSSIVSPTDIIINNGEYVWSGGVGND